MISHWAAVMTDGRRVKLGLQRKTGAGGEDLEIGSHHEVVCICQ